MSPVIECDVDKFPSLSILFVEEGKEKGLGVFTLNDELICLFSSFPDHGSPIRRFDEAHPNATPRT